MFVLCIDVCWAFAGFFDFQVWEGLWGFTPGRCDRTLGVLIAMHRGCISEFYRFRQRRARQAQKLESTTQEKGLWGCWVPQEVRLCKQNIVANRTYVVSYVEICQVGIERVQRSAQRNSVVSSLEARVTKDSWHSSRTALSKCQSAQKELCWVQKKTKYMRSSARGSAKWALSIYTGLLNTLKVSTRGCLSRRIVEMNKVRSHKNYPKYLEYNKVIHIGL